MSTVLSFIFTHNLYLYREDKISTEALYAILVRSGLPRELLGHLWGLCNKHTPGQLIKEELYLLLAMVAAAQVQ